MFGKRKPWRTKPSFDSPSIKRIFFLGEGTGGVGGGCSCELFEKANLLGLH